MSEKAQLYRNLSPEELAMIKQQQNIPANETHCGLEPDDYVIDGGSVEEALPLLLSCNSCPKLQACTYEAARIPNDAQIMGGIAPRERTIIDKNIDEALNKKNLSPEALEKARVASRYITYRLAATNRINSKP